MKWLFVALGGMVSFPAFAGCSNDMDCKGDRVCDAGECRDPTKGAAPLPSAPGLSQRHDLQLKKARRVATTGYVGAGLTAVLGAGAIANLEEQAPAMALGGGALLATGICLPVAAAGGARARRVAREAGGYPPPAALPAVAWVGYGISMLNGVGLLALGAAEEEAPAPMVISAVGVGTLSTFAMAVDAATSSSSVRQDLSRGTVSVVPALWPDREATRVGVAGRF